MTRLFACVRSRSEAEAVAAAGFDGTEAAMADLAAPLAELIAGDGARHRLRRFTDALPDEAMLEALTAAGTGGILIGSAGRLLDELGIADLEAVRGHCRARSLLCAFAGGLEQPDMPRLLACDPDILLVGRALRCGQASDGALDPAALRLMRDLVPAEARPLPLAPAAPAAQSRPDRIFLRDLVLPVAIGAYDSERGRLQRVRFSLEAELRGLGRPTRDMRDVVSYDLFHDAVLALTSGRHVAFVETLAEEIAARVLLHPRVLLIRVTVEKLDLGPGAVGVTIERAKGGA